MSFALLHGHFDGCAGARNVACLEPADLQLRKTVMKNKDTQPPVDLSFARSASESPPSPLAATGRRRTQEQGQGDLDDDRQDAPPVEALQGQAVDPKQQTQARK